MTEVKWKNEPDDHDYPAATNYLTLLILPYDVQRIVIDLQSAPIVLHKAKDIMRASGLALLPTDDVHVASDLQKVKDGEPLSPILLLRGQFGSGVPLQVADGFHRVCASYHMDENTDIPCRIADLG